MSLQSYYKQQLFLPVIFFILPLLCTALPFANMGTTSRSIGHDFLQIENVGVVVDTELKFIEEEIKRLLGKYNVSLIDKAFADKELPHEVAENMENLNEGTKYLHGLFQWTD